MNAATTRDPASGPLLVRHEGHTPRERSGCGWRDRLISREDALLSPAAWVHAVDIDGAKLHYHRRSTELYYILDGAGSVLLDGVEQPVTEMTMTWDRSCEPPPPASVPVAPDLSDAGFAASARFRRTVGFR